MSDAFTSSRKVQIWRWSQPEQDPWTSEQTVIYTLLVALELLISATVIVLLILRRNSYPVNATPVLWNVLTHVTSILWAIFWGCESVVKAMENHPAGLFVFTYVSACPMGPAICARLLYIVRTYQEQLKLNQRQPQFLRQDLLGESIAIIKHRKQLSKSQEVLLIFVVPCATFLLFPTGIILDRYVLIYEKDPDLIIDFSPGMAVTFMSVLSIFFAFAYLAFKLKETKEEFNLKAQYLKFAIWALLFENCNLMIMASGLHRSNGTLLLIVRLCNYFTNFGCTFFLGTLTLLSSFHEERKMRRRMAEKSRKASLTNAPRLLTITSVSDLKRIFMNPKNAEQVDMFQAYTVREFCVENMLCARAILQLSGLSDKIKLLEAVHRILNEHIRPGVEAEINISDELRTTTIETVSNLDVETVTSTIYQNVEYELYMMLLSTFNRFVAKESVVLDCSLAGQSSM